MTFYKLAHTVVLYFFKVVFGFKSTGSEVVPMRGRIILAANHQSALDPPAVGIATKRELHFLAKKELFSIPLLGTAIKNLNSIPLDRGAGDIKALKTFISILENDDAVILFPEGTRSKDGQMKEAKEGVGFLAMRTKSDIIPVYVSGTFQPKKAFLRKPAIKVAFGRRIYLKDYENFDLDMRDLYKKISDDVWDEVKHLRDENSN
jgi:1-acyl-sn-glycerol-3-phosphate acyltransferase